jgi:hypothetical protein
VTVVVANFYTLGYVANQTDLNRIIAVAEADIEVRN